MTPELDLHAPEGIFIGGEWVPTAEGRTFDSICAATGEVIATVPDATEPDVDRAMRAAREAYESNWANTSAEERYEFLMELADRILKEEDRLKMIEVVDSGAALGGDVETAALFLRM
jgi:acyl-CoA reductase-like NAD-dependent aldehyde dehydrogenase